MKKPVQNREKSTNEDYSEKYYHERVLLPSRLCFSENNLRKIFCQFNFTANPAVVVEWSWWQCMFNHALNSQIPISNPVWGMYANLAILEPLSRIISV